LHITGYGHIWDPKPIKSGRPPGDWQLGTPGTCTTTRGPGKKGGKREKNISVASFTQTAYLGTHTLEILPQYLAQNNLKMNPDKSEFYTIDRRVHKTLSIRLLGSQIGDFEDINIRINNAQIAFRNASKFFNIGHYTIPVKKRIQIYKTLILPHLLYNMECTGLSIAQLKPLDSFHRGQLRRVLGIFYPKTITPGALYARTKTQALSLIIAHRRWQFLGKIMRISLTKPQLPAFLAMERFYACRNIAERRQQADANPGTPPT
jgi:hypothetical protein